MDKYFQTTQTVKAVRLVLSQQRNGTYDANAERTARTQIKIAVSMGISMREIEDLI